MGNAVGLDLGSRAFKAVMLNKAKAGFVLSGLAYQDLPYLEEEVPREQVLEDNLRKFAKEGGLRIKDVIVSLSGEYTNISPATEMDKMPKEELRNILMYDIEQHLPVNPEESVIDFQIQGDSKADATKMMVLLSAGRLEMAEALYKAVSQAKLRCSVIDADDLALANMFEVNYGWDDDYRKVVCLINVGSRATSVLIFDEGEYRFSKSTMIAGETLTKDIQREFSLKPDQAEDLKREQAKIVVEDSSSFSLSMFDREDRSLRIFETISGSLNKMVAEIKRFFDFYETRFKGRSVERVLLAGGGADLRNLDRFLADKLQVQVEFADPFRQIQVSPKVTNGDLIEKHAKSFSVGVGLALRRFG